jgi:polysaccharide export outer membrane protein
MHKPVTKFRALWALGGLTAAGLASGCAMLPPNSFLDPTKVGRFPLMGYHENAIRRVLTPRETPAGIADATEPTPADLVPPIAEYRISTGDQLLVAIDDLLYQGDRFTTQQEVTPTGYIRLPTLGLVKVIGMTELELENELKARVREAELVPDPVVQVLVQLKRDQYFLINGDVNFPGPYALTQPDLRLLEAITMARDVNPNAKRLYVIRRTERRPGEPAPEAAPSRLPTEELIVPVPTEEEPPGMTAGFSGRGPVFVQQPPEEDEPPTTREMEEVLAPTPRAGQTEPTTTAPDEGPFPRLIFVEPEKDGAVEVSPEGREPRPGERPPALPEERPFRWEDVPEIQSGQRVIEIDVQALKSGDATQNIVIHNRDVITIPVDTGVYYLMGEINRVGVFGFGGREITLKQAVGAIGGGLSPLAWPQRVEIIRRERGSDKQLTIPVDLDRIFYGLDPDVVLRDEDIVNVGTHTLAPFLFVIRNSFRFTYGFGFVYDRNFADKDSYFARNNPEAIQQARRASRGLPF